MAVRRLALCTSIRPSFAFQAFLRFRTAPAKSKVGNSLVKFCRALSMLVIERATATVTGVPAGNVRYPPTWSPVMLVARLVVPLLVNVP